MNVQIALTFSESESSINSGKVHEKMDTVFPVLLQDSVYKTELKFNWPSGFEDKILLKVDIDSSEEEIESEMAYWMDQVKTYDPPDFMRKPIMSAIKWMGSLLSQ